YVHVPFVPRTSYLFAFSCMQIAQHPRAFNPPPATPRLLRSWMNNKLATGCPLVVLNPGTRGILLVLKASQFSVESFFSHRASPECDHHDCAYQSECAGLYVFFGDIYCRLCR